MLCRFLVLCLRCLVEEIDKTISIQKFLTEHRNSKSFSQNRGIHSLYSISIGIPLLYIERRYSITLYRKKSKETKEREAVAAPLFGKEVRITLVINV